MKNNIGYTKAIELGQAALQNRDPAEICANTGVSWDGETYIMPWMGKSSKLTEGSIEEQIIWYHYLATQGPKEPAGRYINYKQVPGAAIYNDNYVKRAINPMVKTFSHDLDGFLKRGENLGGKKVDLGHMAFTVNVLPFIPITFVIWQ